MKNDYNVKSVWAPVYKSEEDKEVEKIYPNAYVEEVRRKAIIIPRSNQVYAYGPREDYKKYIKGDFGYWMQGKDIKAIYIPSMKKELKIMFEWNPQKRKWILLTYREGDR